MNIVIYVNFVHFIMADYCILNNCSYICNVFFIVLDLRLKRLEQGVAPFLFLYVPNLGLLLSGILYLFC